MTHREGWRDPLLGDDPWQQIFAQRHPLETRILLHFWRSLTDRRIAPAQRVLTLEGVDALLRQHAPSGDPVT